MQQSVYSFVSSIVYMRVTMPQETINTVSWQRSLQQLWQQSCSFVPPLLKLAPVEKLLSSSPSSYSAPPRAIRTGCSTKSSSNGT
eukprot:450960-Rhodomonas_salina.1